MRTIVKTTAAATAIALGLLSAAALALPGNGGGGPPIGQGQARGRPLRGRSMLAAPDGATTDVNARGVVDVRFFGAIGHRVERSWLRFRLHRLTPGATYTLWMDDPNSLTQPNLTQVPDVTLTADSDGFARLRFDTKHGDTLPFGATLVQLGGTAVEIHNADGVAVLTGTVPTLH